MRNSGHALLWLSSSAISLSAGPAVAAEITDIADAADTVTIGELEKDDPFDFYFNSNFTMILQNGKITREAMNRPGVQNANCANAASSRDCLPVDELRYSRATNIFDFGGEAGLFHDLSLTFGFHYVMSDLQKLRFAKDVSEDTSTIDPATGTALFPVRDGYQAKHVGFGPVDLGLKLGPLSDERDDSKPAWVVYVNWANPWMSKRFEAATRATPSTPGPVGDGVHRITFGTAFSKRVGNFGLIGIDPEVNRRGFLDPYMDFNYTLPVPQRGRADAANITAESFGKRPAHQAHFAAGAEIVGLEDLKNGRRVAIDLGLCSAFISEGRNPTMAFGPPGYGGCTGQGHQFSQLVDALGELTYTEQYFHVGGILGIYIQAAEFIRFKAGLGLGYDTEHFLTYEDPGTDNNQDGLIQDPTTDTKNPKDAYNPYYCGHDANDHCPAGTPSYDAPGFRFKAEEAVTFNWFATLMFTF
ncbi:MAG: hypothetical protein HY903_09060 [Deltaproteobacteria bacterium]|nr:hypothetical protein [Deltaproteobacteria bacterium]